MQIVSQSKEHLLLVYWNLDIVDLGIVDFLDLVDKKTWQIIYLLSKGWFEVVDSLR